MSKLTVEQLEQKFREQCSGCTDPWVIDTQSKAEFLMLYGYEAVTAMRFARTE